MPFIAKRNESIEGNRGSTSLALYNSKNSTVTTTQPPPSSNISTIGNFKRSHTSIQKDLAGEYLSQVI
jgi:hypothetical protein